MGGLNMRSGTVAESIHFREYLRVVRKHVKLIVACLLVALTAGAATTYLQRPVYRATTRALIERDGSRMVSFQETTLEHDSATFLQTEVQVIRSRPVIERVITTTGLMSRRPELASVPDPIQTFSEAITVEAVKNTRLIEISVEDHDPNLAAELVNKLAAAYVDLNLELRLAAARATMTWLTSQVSDLKAKMNESEQTLQKYHEQAGLIAVDEKQSLAVRNLAEANHSYLDAKARRLEMETRLGELRKANRHPEALESTPVVINNPLIQRLKGQLVEMEVQRSRQLKTLTSRHPEALELQSQVDEIRTKIKEEVSRIVLSIESEYSALKARENALLAAVNQYRDEAQRFSQKEIQSGILKRDAGSNQQLYETLLKRLNESGLSQGLDLKSVRVVEPAIVPVKPIKPRKTIIIGLAAVAGLGLGMFLAFFAEYMDDTLRTPEKAEQALGVPVLALIPPIRSRRRS